MNADSPTNADSATNSDSPAGYAPGRRLTAAAVLLGRVVVRFPRWIVVGLFRMWQLLVSPAYGQTCRFYPTCSTYGCESVAVHGVVKGLALTSWRILRCNPWNGGGVDLVPPHRTSRSVAKADHSSNLHEARDPSRRPAPSSIGCSDDSVPHTRRAA